MTLKNIHNSGRVNLLIMIVSATSVITLCICTAAFSFKSSVPRSQNSYWEDLSPTEQTKILKTPTTNNDAVAYYQHTWKASDDKRTFDLLNALTTFQGGSDTEKFYFHIFNEILLASDGALAEAMGDYSMQMIYRNPSLAIAYFTRDEEVQEKYASVIGYELSFYDDASNPGSDFKGFKKKLESTLPREIRKQHSKTLAEFYASIEKAIANARN